MAKNITLTKVDSVVLSVYKDGPIIANYRIMAGTEEVRTASRDITALLTAAQKTAIANFLTQVTNKLSQLEVE